MTIEQLGSLGEFMAAIATLATLVYLAIQIRQNTKQLRFSNAASLWEGLNSAFDPVYQGDNQRIFQQAMSGQELPPEEMMAFRFICFRAFSHFYQLHTHGNEGQLSDSELQMHKSVVITLLTAPGVRQWWEEVGKDSFPPDFSKEVSQYLVDSESFDTGVKVWQR